LGTSERRIETIKYLCRKRRATMAEISKEFGVSVRTVKRDIDYLSGVMILFYLELNFSTLYNINLVLDTVDQ